MKGGAGFGSGSSGMMGLVPEVRGEDHTGPYLPPVQLSRSSLNTE